jgi:hypothetical protein
MIRIIASAAFAAALVVTSALAQKGETVNVKGKIASVDGSTLVVDQAKGAGQAKIAMNEKVMILTIGPGTIKDLTKGAYIGVGAMPQADGSQRAMQITVFAESQRGLGEGFRPWDRAPNSTMTNGTVDTRVGSVDGPTLTVKYKGGEKKIVVPSDAVILAYSVGDKSDLKPGAHIAIIGAKPRADGTLDAGRVNVGLGDVVPR